MNIQQILLEWAEKQAYYRKGYVGKQYSPFLCHTMNVLDERVRLHETKGDGYICKWESPYGFVPEAGCPLHD